MFSWTKGSAIARVDGGVYNNKKIRYSSERNNENKIKVNNPMDYVTSKWFKERSDRKRLTALDLDKLYKCLIAERPPENDYLFDLYQQALEYIGDQSSNEINIEDGKIILLPPPVYKLAPGEFPQTSRIFCAGPTGSGKSTWCAGYIREIVKQRRCKNIYIFSNLSDDPVLDKISPTPKRIKLDENLVDPPIKLAELANSIILFDDIDAIKDDIIRKAVQKLRDECNAEGRHHSIFCLSTGHQLLNYKNTRNMHSDCNYITFFPRSGGDFWIKSFLKNYCGCGKQETDKIMNLPSRWVTIKKDYPMICFYSSGLFLMGVQNIKPKVTKPKEEPKEDEYLSDDYISKSGSSSEYSSETE